MKWQNVLKGHMIFGFPRIVQRGRLCRDRYLCNAPDVIKLYHSLFHRALRLSGLDILLSDSFSSGEQELQVPYIAFLLFSY